MNVFFGTVEYFEKEFLTYAASNHLSNLSNDQISAFYSKMKDELLHDFVCTERIRLECLENLKQACLQTDQFKRVRGEQNEI